MYLVKKMSIRQLVSLGVITFLSLFLVACGGGAGTVGIATGTALYTTAPSTITINSGTTSYTIGGGTAPYKSSSSNANVATTEVKGSTLTISGLSSGVAQITVVDAVGASVTLALTVGSGNTVTALFTTAPSQVTVGVGATTAFTIGGGKPTYVISSSNTSVATVAINNNLFIITGVTAGAAQIAVFDATGSAVTFNVTVGSGAVTALYTTAASTVLVASGETATFSVAGGTAPYTATSNNASAITASVSGPNLSIKGVATGTAQVLLFDAKGASVTITATVAATGSATTLYTAAPSSLTFAVGEIGSYTVGGGTGPYSVATSNRSAATASIAGNKLTVTGIAVGIAQINVIDSLGASVVVTVNVGSAGVATSLYTTSGSAVNLAAGTTNTYSIGGGTTPYTSTSSNTAVATASVSGNTLSIRGIAAGSAQVLVFDATGTSVNIAVTTSQVTTSLYTTSASAVNLAAGITNTYTVGGGTAPYTSTSSNTAVATASVSGNTLSIRGIAAGSAQVLVFDATGTSVNIAVTTSQSGSVTIDVQPNGASANVGDVLQFLVSGGTAPYNITVNNPSIAAVSPTTVAASGGAFAATLLNAGSTNVTIVDALGQTKAFTLTVSQLSTSLRLSPSAIIIGEDSTIPLSFNIYGGTGPYRAFTSDQTLSSVSITGATLTIGLGSNLNRCINPIDSSGLRIPQGTFDVIVTVVDSLGASATSIMTIKDNGVGNGSVVTQPAPFVAPCT
ncbi:beta strand repeat-containing protein [Undibacterium sp. Ji50W]|uniref:beta strand repeat-containing protein n=1 Tax=Undibacterium sp. Ji50W TaxID=3413041 RepID=UPI003BF1A63F